MIIVLLVVIIIVILKWLQVVLSCRNAIVGHLEIRLPATSYTSV